MRRLLCAALLSALIAGAANAQGITPAPGGGSGSGTVTSLSAGAGVTLTPNPTTSTGSVAVTNPSPSTSVTGDVLSFSNTTGGLQDSGILASALPTIHGTITPGDCANWFSTTALGDAGAGCGSSGGGASLTAPNTWTPNGAASTAAEIFTGTLFTGGSGTTTFPYLYLDFGATASTSLSVNGTEIGINAPSGFVGNIIDAFTNGSATHSFTVNASGVVTTGGNIQAGATSAVGINGRGNFTSGAVGHYNFNGSAPALSACGSSTIDANAHDTAGTITFAGSPSTCTVTFAIAYTTFAHCIVTFPSALAGAGYSYTKTAITITATALTGTADYRCDGT